MHEITAGTAAAAVITAVLAVAGIFYFIRPDKKTFLINFIPWMIPAVLICAAYTFKGAVLQKINVSGTDAAIMAFVFTALALLFLERGKK